MGAVLREQNALPCDIWITMNLTAKAAIDNGGAGRAAKGATPTTSKKTKTPISRFSFLSKPNVSFLRYTRVDSIFAAISAYKFVKRYSIKIGKSYAEIDVW